MRALTLSIPSRGFPHCFAEKATERLRTLESQVERDCSERDVRANEILTSDVEAQPCKLCLKRQTMRGQMQL